MRRADSIDRGAWQLNSKPERVRLRYGDLVQTLRASSQGAHLNLQDVQISHSDIRGEIVSTDRVSTGGDEKTSGGPLGGGPAGD